jgi:hypothetical protein
MCPSDTTPEAWRIFLELQRQMPPEEKLRRAFELSATVRRAAEAGLRERYPDADDREIFLRLARLILGAELCERVYGKVAWPDERAR